MRVLNHTATAGFGLLVLALSCLPCLAQDADLPGSGDAIEKAIEQAALNAATEILDLLPPEIETLAIFPLQDDTEAVATAAFEEAMTQVFSARGLKLVTRSDEEWFRLTGEWEFTEENFDVMPKLPEFRNVHPAGAMAWGRLRYARIDDSEIKAQARIEVKVGVPDSGVVRTSIGNGLAAIDPDTLAAGFLVKFMRTPWFWFTIVAGVVAAVVIIIIAVPLRRKMKLASKPREIVR